MSRIIFLNDIFDVKNHSIIPRSHFVNKTTADILYTKRLEAMKQPAMSNTGHDFTVTNKYNLWSRYLGPYVVASSIKEKLPDYDVVVIDYFTKLDNFFDYLKLLVTEDTEYIALSLTFLNNPFNPRQNSFNLWCFTHEEMCEWFAKVKETAPKAKILVGGAIVDTVFKTQIINNKIKTLPQAMIDYVDYAFHGYAEDSIIKFLTNTVDPKNIYEKDGVKFIDEPALAGTGARLIHNKWENNFGVQQGEWLPLEISKGCRFGCKFCFYDHGGTIIKDPELLRKELMYNYEHFGTTGYSLTDDTVNDSIEKINMMYEVFTSLPFKIEWVGYARPDMFHKYPEMLTKMLEMGCRGMFLGIETLSHTAGKVAGKGLHPDKIKNILTWMKDVAKDEAFIFGSFIIGLPGETEETLMETAQWLRDQRSLDKAQYEIFFVADTGGRTTSSFSQNSNKFGIKKVLFVPEYYWEHGTLNLNQCKEIALKWEEMMANHPTTKFERHSQISTSFWTYPRIRSLGFDHKETVKILSADSMPDEVHELSNAWLTNYFRELLDKNVRPNI